MTIRAGHRGLTAPTLPRLWWLRSVLTLALITTNLVGAVAVYALIALVIPLPAIANQDSVRHANLVMAAIFTLSVIPIAMLRGWFITRSVLRFVREGREPNERERKAVLRTPARLFLMQAALWTAAAGWFGFYNARQDLRLGVLVGVTVGMAGLTTCAFAYLISERILRALARLALESGVPSRLGMRMGVRLVLAWVLGSGIASAGILMAGLTALTLGNQVSLHKLAVAMVVLGGAGLYVGAMLTFLAARGASDPIRALRSAVTDVSAGDLAATVPIYDGTEIGVLQAGFNDMVEGLRERETIRDLFGRHVGSDVAKAALERGVALGGETREVAVLFVDIIGSTSLASQRPPQEVVDLLNRFFEVVIDVVHQHGGWINKFEGDAALAIWGAPEETPDMALHVLRAARELSARLRENVPELRAGIGVSAGPAVAGNVGTAQRYEYTVIGDPVNEAARLTGEAKQVPALVVANAALLDAAPQEAELWFELSPIVVRGRDAATRIATPR